MNIHQRRRLARAEALAAEQKARDEAAAKLAEEEAPKKPAKKKDEK